MLRNLCVRYGIAIVLLAMSIFGITGMVKWTNVWAKALTTQFLVGEEEEVLCADVEDDEDDDAGYQDDVDDLKSYQDNHVDELRAYIERTDAKFGSCQIIYIVGVEGSKHHGWSTVLHALAQHQDPTEEHIVTRFRDNKRFRKAAGMLKNDDRVSPEVVVEHMQHVCPPDDGRHHIVLEDASFPSGREKRDELHAPKSVADMDALIQRLRHPVDLEHFAKKFKLFGTVHFVVLHRPYLNTVKSHPEFDEDSLVLHGNIISGYLRHLGDVLRQTKIPQTLVCIDDLSERANSYLHGQRPRDEIIQRVAQNLDWNLTTCEECFSTWKESSKDAEEEDTIDPETMSVLLEQRKSLHEHWLPLIERACDEL